VDSHIDEHDAEFESFLRQFEPRQPPALKAPLVTPNRMLIAVGIATASAMPIAWLWHAPAPATPAAPTIEDRELVPLTGVPQVRSAPAGQSVGRPLRVGDDIPAPPAKVYHADPIYPEDAKAAEIHGVVVIHIVVGDEGSVRDAQVVKSVPLLDQAAIDAVLQWQFRPTLLNGEAVEVEMDVVVNFVLP